MSLAISFVLEQVLVYFGYPFRIVAGEGVKYPGGFARVPKGTAFVTFVTCEISLRVIDRMLKVMAPTPIVEGSSS